MQRKHAPEYHSLTDEVARQEFRNLRERQQRLAETRIRVQTRQMQLELHFRRLQRELERVTEKLDSLLTQRPDVDRVTEISG